MAEEEILELLLEFLPETAEGWLACTIAVSAVLSYVLPVPGENAHPLLRAGHKFIRVLGLGAAKIRGAGKIGVIPRRRGK